MTCLPRSDAEEPVSRTDSVRTYFSRPGAYLTKDFVVRVRAELVSGILGELPGSSTVLDVGCGDGRIAAPLLGRGHQVTLLDPSAAMLELARANVPASAGQRAEIVEGDLHAIDPRRRFDVVLCLGVLAHVESAEETLACLVRAVRPGGQLLIQVTDAATWIGRLHARYASLREQFMPSYGYQLKVVTAAQVSCWAETAGLRRARVIRYSLLLPGMMRLLPNALLYRLELLSRRWPLCLLGGESILVFTKAR